MNIDSPISTATMFEFIAKASTGKRNRMSEGPTLQRPISTLLLLFVVSISSSVISTRANAQATLPHPVTLSTGWQLQDVSKIPQNADMVATLGFETKGWYAATVPG